MVQLTCGKAAGTGTVTNKQTGEAMSLTFGTSTAEMSECKMLAPASGVGKCTVAVAKTETARTDPMNLGIGAEKEGPTGEKVKVVEEGKGTEMGGKVTPTSEGAILTKITIAGAECPAALKGEFPVQGSFYVLAAGRPNTEATTSSGATAVITKTTSLGGLKFAGNAATLEGTFTVRKEGGNPLIVTTTAF